MCAGSVFPRCVVCVYCLKPRVRARSELLGALAWSMEHNMHRDCLAKVHTTKRVAPSTSHCNTQCCDQPMRVNTSKITTEAAVLQAWTWSLMSRELNANSEPSSAPQSPQVSGNSPKQPKNGTDSHTATRTLFLSHETSSCTCKKACVYTHRCDCSPAPRRTCSLHRLKHRALKHTARGVLVVAQPHVVCVVTPVRHGSKIRPGLDADRA